MATWNMFSADVAQERDTVRAYGLENVMDRCRQGDSYKAQALRQLAMRLELEEQVKTLRREINVLINRVEELEV